MLVEACFAWSVVLLSTWAAAAEETVGSNVIAAAGVTLCSGCPRAGCSSVTAFLRWLVVDRPNALFSSLRSWSSGACDEIRCAAARRVHASLFRFASFAARFCAIKAAIRWGCVSKHKVSPSLGAAPRVARAASGSIVRGSDAAAGAGTGVCCSSSCAPGTPLCGCGCGQVCPGGNEGCVGGIKPAASGTCFPRVFGLTQVWASGNDGCLRGAKARNP